MQVHVSTHVFEGPSVVSVDLGRLLHPQAGPLAGPGSCRMAQIAYMQRFHLNFAFLRAYAVGP